VRTVGVRIICRSLQPVAFVTVRFQPRRGCAVKVNTS
jgi:hypothetical protein